MAWVWLLALAAAECEGETVEIDGTSYTWREDSGCGNGRHAECTADHVLASGPECTGPSMHEQFGGGTSSRYVTVTGATPGQRDWLLSKTGVRRRTRGALDVLADPLPALSEPVGPSRLQSARVSRWVDGQPQKPRQSWTPTECSSDDEAPETECFRVFRGDQVDYVATIPVADGVKLRLFANDFRNRRVYYVLHDEKADRHGVLAGIVTMGGLPETIGRMDGGVLLQHPVFMDSGTVLELVTPEGTLKRVRIDDDLVHTDTGWRRVQPSGEDLGPLDLAALFARH